MHVTRSNLFAATAAIALLGFQAFQPAAATERIFDKTFTATAGGTLTVDTDQGSIVVKGGDGHEVVVHVAASGTDAQLRDFEVGAEADSRGVTVRGKRDHDWWMDLSWFFGGGLRAKFEIRVPRDYHVELRTSGGSLEAENINGRVHGHTSGGHLTLNSINGDIDVHTSGGRIEARQLSGNALLRTSGGSITVADAKAELDVRTSGGGIRLQNVEGRVDARTSGGSIEASIRGINRGVNLRTSGGGIRIEVPSDFKATLDAHTSGGSIDSELPLTSRGYDDRDRHKHDLDGDINGGGERLTAHTSGGSIRIRARN